MPDSPSIKFARLAGALFLALMVASCTSSAPKLYSVKGQVFHGDAPAEGATVVFQLKNAGPNAPSPSGTVQADGSFTLRTHPYGEGAPSGEYVVLITWYPEDAREQETPKNKLPARYANPDETPLQATVTDQPLELEPFKIPKK
ncbi:MAG: hypothetical protein L0241_17740 [Planctomycetia bacterium]|nr:hypothetical protein [Planctomycetia bacterium]